MFNGLLLTYKSHSYGSHVTFDCLFNTLESLTIVLDCWRYDEFILKSLLIQNQHVRCVKGNREPVNATTLSFGLQKLISEAIPVTNKTWIKSDKRISLLLPRTCSQYICTFLRLDWKLMLRKLLISTEHANSNFGLHLYEFQGGNTFVSVCVLSAHKLRRNFSVKIHTGKDAIVLK